MLLTLHCDLTAFLVLGEEDSEWSIPVPQFPKLLSLLEKDIKAWIRDERPVSKFNGQPVRWDGKSYVYKEYFEQKKIDPKIHPRYSKFYVNRRHTIAGSYVWADKKLSEFADVLAKPIHA